MKIFNFGLTKRLLIQVLAFSIYISVSANYILLSKITEAYPFHDNFGFVASLVFINALIVGMLLLVVGAVVSLRLSAFFLCVVAAVSTHFMQKFGCVIDVDMIRNVAQTDLSESGDLLSASMWSRLFVFGVTPGLIFYRLFKPKPQPLTSRLASGLTVGIAAFAIGVFLVLPYSNQYAIFIREHKSLRYYANPATAVYSMVKYASETAESASDTEYTRLTESISVTEKKDKPDLVIMVVGETARADHFQVNGYSRNTTPRLAARDDLAVFTAVTSCGTSTAISVPCMFAYDNRRHFDVEGSANRQNVIDILSETGINVLWRDNNSSSKGVADRVNYENFRSESNNPECDTECRDVGMLSGLNRYIDTSKGDILIVLHQMGSHGPAYFKRYPKEHTFFSPICEDTDFSNCNTEQIQNAYDNSIRYTDYFLNRVIEFLTPYSKDYDTTMLYVSDHGESLGESGIYLHGMPYIVAPEAQTLVPMILWLGGNTKLDAGKIREYRHRENSHDAIFETLLTLFGISVDLPSRSENPIVYLR